MRVKTKAGAHLEIDSVEIIRGLFSLFPIPIAVVDETGQVIMANSAFADLFGKIDDLSSIPQHEFEAPGVGTFELERYPLSEACEIVYARDVTNECVLRGQLVHAEKLAVLGRQLAGIIHEINNPLSSILGYSQVLSQTEADPERRRMMDVIVSQAERAGKITRNCLKLAGKAPVIRSPLDLHEAVRNVIKLREYEQQLINIKTTFETAAELPLATADADQIQQVILNLIVNAEDAILETGRQNGEIKIRTSLASGRALISISDNGTGIRPSDLSKIFNPFFTTKDAERGTGLGLAICAEIVKDHGGDLSAYSSYGSGSTFTIELPAGMAVEPEARSAPESENSTESLHGKRILVIDDESHMRQLISEVLTLNGCMVDTACSGAEALERIHNAPYDIVICDQRMPGLTGGQFYEMVQSNEASLASRFLFMTGDVASTRSDDQFSKSGVPVIRKPFRIEELLAAVVEIVVPAKSLP